MYRFFLVCVAAICMIAFLSCNVHTNTWRVYATSFRILLDSLQDVTLLDVRTEEEWKKGVIGQPVMMDYYRSDFKQKVLGLPKNKPIFIYCHSGYRSQKTRKWLLRNGYSEVYDLREGVLGWKKSGFSTNNTDILPFQESK